jgi:CDP-diacylglycerol--glycerol-3-phosphate 3-phosphatidyltransferase
MSPLLFLSAWRILPEVNLPNSITTARIFAVPLLIWILSSHIFYGRNGEQELLASFVFILASVTDGLDGYLARRRQQVTTLGMLLDPLADKLLIAGAYIALVQYAPKIVSAWVAVIIIGREFLVTGLRSIAAQEGFTIQASDVGKFKMVIQIISVVAVILAHRWDYWGPVGGYIFPVHVIAVTSIWFMVAVSLFSAFDYFWGFWQKIDRQAEKRRKRKRIFVLKRRRSDNESPAT